MGAIRSRLRRWHVWLGWLVGLPFLFWTVSGLVMVARPIEEVRGEHLIAEPRPISIAGALVAPNVEGHVLEGVGHWTQQERPAEVNRLLLDWLGRLPERELTSAD